jgi:hypothetical protein
VRLISVAEVRIALLIAGLAMGSSTVLLAQSVPNGQGSPQDPPIAQAVAPLESADSAVEASPSVVKPPSRDETHIFGIVPNYAAVNDPTHPFIAISAKEKFDIAAHDAFDPFSWVTSGLYAAVAQRQNQYPAYGQGLNGYAKRFGGAFADGAIGSFLSEAILPSILHQDPRYFRLGDGTKLHRISYAMSRVLVTRTDAGNAQFNFSEIFGNLGGAAMSNLYYPPGDRSAPQTIEKFTVSVFSDAGFNVLREFWPDMRHSILHK